MDFQVFDIFGIGLGLRYLNKQEYQTKFGAITSLVIGVLIVIQVVLVGTELFTKKNPEVIFAERFVSSPERQDIKRDTFNFALGAQRPETFAHFIDETVYSVSATMISMEKKLNETNNEYYQDWKNLPIEIRPCKEIDFEVKETIDYFKTLPGIDDMYCLNYDSQELFMEGNFDQDSYGVIQIKFELCKDKPTCKKEEDIIKLLTNSFVAYYSNDIIINPKERDPFTKIGRDFYWNASPTVAKDIYMFFRNAYVESDNGIFFEEKSMNRATTFSYSNEQIIFGENSYYFSLFMRFEKAKESVYHRKYKKLDSALADIGGMAKALLIIGFILCMPINQLNLHLQLSNSLFNYKKNNHQSNDPQTNSNVQGQELIKIIETTQQQNKINQEQQNQLQQQSSQKVKLNQVLKQMSPKKVTNQKLTIETQSNQMFFTNSDRNIQMMQLNSNNDQDVEPFQKQQSLNPDQVDSIALKGVESTPNNPQDSNSMNVLKLIQLSKKMKSNAIPSKNQNNHQNQSNNQTHQNKEKTLMKRQSTMARQSTLKNPSSNQNDKESSNSSSLELSWSDYIKYYLFPWGNFSTKKKQIDYSIEKIYSHLDMLYLVQKLLELEKLKSLLLDDNQIKLIQFLPKPLIDVSSLDRQKKEEEDQLKKSKNKQINKEPNKKNYSITLLNNTVVDEKLKAKEAYEALQNIIKKDNLTELDKRIIQMLDASIFEHINDNAEYLEQLNQADANQDLNSQGGQQIQQMQSTHGIYSNNQLNQNTNNNLPNQKQIIVEMNHSQESSIDNKIVEEYQNIPQSQRIQEQNERYQSLNIQSIAQLTTPLSSNRNNLLTNEITKQNYQN